jgi:ADP-heptose:LPS heptosyltransferase
MKNNILFFSIDRLGDYLIRSNVIYSITKHYKNSDIICSNVNYKLIKRQPFFTNVHLFDNSKKTREKIRFIKNFIFKKYDSVISFDGKNISSLLLFLIRADFKFVFIHKKYGYMNNLKTKLYCSFLNVFNIKYETLNNRKFIELLSPDHYPTKYRSLKKYYNNINDNTYYLENFDLDYKVTIKEKFIIIHLDEKFNDIVNIDKDFTQSLKTLSSISSKKIILTSYKNKENYYKNINIKKIPFKKLDEINLQKEKIFILEDVPLIEFYYLIKRSDLNFSCHAGFFVHASLYNKKKTIDLISSEEESWLNSWITKEDNYQIMYKSNINKKYSILDILTKLNYEIKKL